MKIKVTEERDCCQPQDLKPVEGCAMVGRFPAVKFCIHCGHWHVYRTSIDAAGSTDWEYVKEKEHPA